MHDKDHKVGISAASEQQPDTTQGSAVATPRYPLGEEIAGSIIHGLGACLGVAALSILVTLAGIFGDTLRVVSFSIYGGSLILLFLASTLYHGIQHPRAKHILRIIDHCSIFLLIAGTYTPFTLISMRGPWGWTIFGIIWGLAVIGILFALFFVGRFQIITVLMYLGMGWTIIIAIKPMFAMVPLGGLIWLAIGGFFYSFGVIFYVMERIPYNHAIWHLFVLGGAISHFFAIVLYVLPM